jgi:hypothetical protein
MPRREVIEVLTNAVFNASSLAMSTLMPREREATGRLATSSAQAQDVAGSPACHRKTPEDSIMSDVLPSIIVLAITALLVFRRDRRPTRSRRNTQHSARSFKVR